MNMQLHPPPFPLINTLALALYTKSKSEFIYLTFVDKNSLRKTGCYASLLLYCMT